MRFGTNAVLCAAVAGLALSLTSGTVHGAVITPGNLVVYRVGDGVAALPAATTAATFLDEYTPTGSLVQSITIPSTGALSSTSLGTATTEGIITPSEDGTKLVFMGYRKDVGGTPAAADPRVIGTLTSTGVVDTSLAVTTSIGTPRSATTVSGLTYYLGTSTAIFYVGTPSGASTATSIDVRNSRQVFLANGNLFASNGSTALAPKVQHYGQSPTGATTATPVVSLATADAVNGIYFLDESASVPGVDTLYALATTLSQLQKYTFNGTSWAASGTVSTGSADLTAIASGTNVNLYLTNGTSILSLVDSSGYGGTLTGTPTSIATAGTNTAFRGIGILPSAANLTTVLLPEPTTLVGMAGTALLALRRKKSR